jgi:hypothetical protein
MEDIMVKKIEKVLIGIFFAFVLIGCATQPLTQKLMNDIGVDDIDRFQYYISADVKLTATERIREPNVDNKGTARIKESSYRDVIIISKNTMGVLMDSSMDENGVITLEICFEESPLDSDKRIIFKQDAPGLERNFYIAYIDPRKRSLQYGNREFTLEINTGERVYLNIKVKKSEIEKKRIRHVKGRKVEN